MRSEHEEVSKEVGIYMLVRIVYASFTAVVSVILKTSLGRNRPTRMSRLKTAIESQLTDCVLVCVDEGSNEQSDVVCRSIRLHWGSGREASETRSRSAMGTKR
ncbi:hypothetical protein CC80DRAFT_210476 [Byssothecium circinans]|uniref:Uncharacterized protein n=1 Tax=Byssothecium circinans TaxID=147558 RepID=A0A6A5TR24_9PLEO|nr:hypothetical protein CC80DRAFT_210476 [Byssothecium circinans]